MKIDPLAQALSDEFKRVAKDEDVPMSELVGEVAALARVSARQIYNFRTGRWPIPARLIPVICRRFKSTALLSTLRGQTQEGTDGKEFECSNIGERSMDLLRVIVDHHAFLINRIGADSFDAADLLRLEETTERIIRGEREMVACAEISYERRRGERRRA